MPKNDIPIEKLPPVLTLKRVAEIAGVSRRTVRQWVSNGKLIATRMQNNGSARLYFDTRDVLRVLGIREDQ